MQHIYFNEQWNETNEKQKNTMDNNRSDNSGSIANSSNKKRTDVQEYIFFE